MFEHDVSFLSEMDNFIFYFIKIYKQSLKSAVKSAAAVFTADLILFL